MKISRLITWITRVVPIAGIVALTSFMVGSEIVSPHRRTIKVTVLFILLVIMWRFEMLYSLFIFIILFPYPSGVALNNTNAILMTLIVLLWVIRANAAGQKLIRRTPIDAFVIMLIIAYMLSFFNVEDPDILKRCLQVFWRELSAIAFCYLIVRFVTSEQKLTGITKVIALSAGLVVFTGMVELFFPGSTLIPGWIGVGHGEGELTARIKGIRLGGAVKSHGVLSDLCTLTILPMGYLFLRAKNPIEKTLWIGIAIMTFIVLLATANRGAFVAFVVGCLYGLYVFRRHLNFVRYALIVTGMIAAFIVGQILLDKYTYAASITSRITRTTFEGVVPDTRLNTWLPALEKSTEHIFIGHGLIFVARDRLSTVYWPHNAYIYYLYTIGIIGLSAFLLILYRLFRLSRRYDSPGLSDSFANVMMKILHVDLLMFAIEQMRTDHQRNADYVYIYVVWMVFGLILATNYILREREGAGDKAPVPEAAAEVQSVRTGGPQPLSGP